MVDISDHMMRTTYYHRSRIRPATFQESESMFRILNNAWDVRGPQCVDKEANQCPSYDSKIVHEVCPDEPAFCTARDLPRVGIDRTLTIDDCLSLNW